MRKRIGFALGLSLWAFAVCAQERAVPPGKKHDLGAEVDHALQLLLRPLYGAPDTFTVDRIAHRHRQPLGPIQPLRESDIKDERPGPIVDMPAGF